MANKNKSVGINIILIVFLIILALIIAFLVIDKYSSSKPSSNLPNEIIIPSLTPEITPTPTETREDRIKKCKKDAYDMYKQAYDSNLKWAQDLEKQRCQPLTLQITRDSCEDSIMKALIPEQTKNSDLYDSRITACMTVQ